MVLQLRVLDALPEESSLGPSTHMGQFTTTSKSCSGDPVLSSALWTWTQVHTHTCVHMHIDTHFKK